MLASVTIVNKDGGPKTYEVPCTSTMSVSQILNYIHDNLEPGLAFRNCFCKRSSCGLCMVVLNGKAVKACKTPAEKVMRIEPLPRKLIRDLVVDMAS